MPSPDVCPTCSAAVSGNYCHQCGQHLHRPRLTMRSIGYELLSIITNIEKGFLHTLLRLFTAPAEVANDFIAGSTARYFRPFNYLLIIGAVFAFIQFKVVGIDRIIRSSPELSKSTEQLEKLMHGDTTGMNSVNVKINKELFSYFDKTKEYADKFSLINIPFTALATLLIFRRRRLNYAEHLVANTYFISQIQLLNIVPLLIFLVLPDIRLYSMFGLIIPLGYTIYAYRPFFGLSGWKGFLLPVLSYFLSAMFAGLVGAVVALCWILYGGALGQ